MCIVHPDGLIVNSGGSSLIIKGAKQMARITIRGNGLDLSYEEDSEGVIRDCKKDPVDIKRRKLVAGVIRELINKFTEEDITRT